MLGFTPLTTQHMTPLTMPQSSLTLVSMAFSHQRDFILLSCCIQSSSSSKQFLRIHASDFPKSFPLSQHPDVLFPLRLFESPSGGQNRGERPPSTGRQSGAAAELQRLRRESGGVSEDSGGPVSGAASS